MPQTQEFVAKLGGCVRPHSLDSSKKGLRTPIQATFRVGTRPTFVTTPREQWFLAAPIGNMIPLLLTRSSKHEHG
jgi:hypothetical protein